MGGLLYKDFTALRGKRLLLVLIILTFVYTILRVIFPGTSEINGFMITNEAGEKINIIDSFFFMATLFILCFGCYFINSWSSKILTFDEKNKIRNYISSMPFSKKTYVASKYIFIAISTYIMFSFYMLWHVITMAFMGESSIKESTYLIAGFSIPFICITLLITAIELPMFLVLGKGKAMMVKVAISMIIGIVVLGYLLFGDLNVLENFDIGLVIKWAESHEMELVLLSILSPVITMILYYCSYRIALRLYEKKEYNNE